VAWQCPTCGRKWKFATEAEQRRGSSSLCAAAARKPAAVAGPVPGDGAPQTATGARRPGPATNLD